MPNPPSFSELGVGPDLVAALARQGIHEPTGIQRAALPLLEAGNNAYLLAETGTGKTLAYLLPIFGRLDPAEAAAQAIVLAPTHELAIQIHRQSCELAQNAGWPVRSLLLIGGTSLDRQLDKLKTRPHVVVGSPGRIRDLTASGKLKTKAVRTIVFDEADRLLMGEGAAGARAIVKALPPARQMVFVSATEQAESAGVIAKLAPDLVMLKPGAEAVNANIAHSYLVCDERDKPRVIRQLLSAAKPERALAFTHLNETAERLASQLVHHHVAVAALHAGMDKLARQRSMEDFRAGRVQVMIASDVAARGLDIPGVTHVINLDVPTQSKAYLHRVGRTGRAGAKGQAITLMTERETKLVARYESDLGIQLMRVRLREGRLIAVGEATVRE
jgi:superfamily II DNA/RNA helicase